MTTPNRPTITCAPGHRRLKRLKQLAAAAALLALTPLTVCAETIERRGYPGSHCTSDGASDLSQLGVRENTAAPGVGNGYQTFSCPIPLPWYVDNPSYSKRILFVSVNFLRNNLGSGSPTSCRLSTSYANGTTLYDEDWAQAVAEGNDRENINLRAELPSNPYSWVAGAVYPKAHLRCRLYNSAAPRNALIGFSIHVFHSNQ